eukprot:1149801-Pelagomonas_calceolata.AAC.11
MGCHVDEEIVSETTTCSVQREIILYHIIPFLMQEITVPCVQDHCSPQAIQRLWGRKHAAQIEKGGGGLPAECSTVKATCLLMASCWHEARALEHVNYAGTLPVPCRSVQAGGSVHPPGLVDPCIRTSDGSQTTEKAQNATHVVARMRHIWIVSPMCVAEEPGSDGSSMLLSNQNETDAFLYAIFMHLFSTSLKVMEAQCCSAIRYLYATSVVSDMTVECCSAPVWPVGPSCEVPLQISETLPSPAGPSPRWTWRAAVHNPLTLAPRPPSLPAPGGPSHTGCTAPVWPVRLSCGKLPHYSTLSAPAGPWCAGCTAPVWPGTQLCPSLHCACVAWDGAEPQL